MSSVCIIEAQFGSNTFLTKRIPSTDRLSGKFFQRFKEQQQKKTNLTQVSLENIYKRESTYQFVVERHQILTLESDKDIKRKRIYEKYLL